MCLLDPLLKAQSVRSCSIDYNLTQNLIKFKTSEESLLQKFPFLFYRWMTTIPSMDQYTTPTMATALERVLSQMQMIIMEDNEHF